MSAWSAPSPASRTRRPGALARTTPVDLDVGIKKMRVTRRPVCFAARTAAAGQENLESNESLRMPRRPRDLRSHFLPLSWVYRSCSCRRRWARHLWGRRRLGASGSAALRVCRPSKGRSPSPFRRSRRCCRPICRPDGSTRSKAGPTIPTGSRDDACGFYEQLGRRDRPRAGRRRYRRAGKLRLEGCILNDRRRRHEPHTARQSE